MCMAIKYFCWTRCHYRAVWLWKLQPLWACPYHQPLKMCDIEPFPCCHLLCPREELTFYRLSCCYSLFFCTVGAARANKHMNRPPRSSLPSTAIRSLKSGCTTHGGHDRNRSRALCEDGDHLMVVLHHTSLWVPWTALAHGRYRRQLHCVYQSTL